MDEWTGLIGAILGAAVGFAAVWWQHREQTMERIQMKGAELIALGDRYEQGRYQNARPYRDGPSKAERQLDILNQMRAIVRYLEVVADSSTYQAANQLCIQTEFLERSDNTDMDAAVSNFYDTRAQLLQRLKNRTAKPSRQRREATTRDPEEREA